MHEPRHGSSAAPAGLLALVLAASACGGGTPEAPADVETTGSAAGQPAASAPAPSTPATVPASATPAPSPATAGADVPTDDPAIRTVRARIEELRAQDRIGSGRAWRTKLPLFPDLEFDPSSRYLWHLDTNLGPITVQLLPEVAPRHAANFVYLSELHYFDGLSFHRVIPGFMAQGGCPLGNGTGGPGYLFAGEFDPAVKHDRPGLLSMANRGANTDGSQFFLTFVPTPWLDGKHTIFGEVVDGTQTLQELEKRGSRGGTTTEPLEILRAWVTVEKVTS